MNQPDGGRRVLFMNVDKMREAHHIERQLGDFISRFADARRMRRQFAVVGYALPRAPAAVR